MLGIERVLWTKSNSLFRTIREFRLAPLASFRALSEGLAPHVPECPDRTRALVRRIMDAYRKATGDHAGAPAAYQLSAEWAPIIRRDKADYTQAFQGRREDAVAGLLHSFFRNSGSAGLVDYGRYEVVCGAPCWRKAQFINDTLHDYLVWQKLTNRQTPEALACPRHGNAWGLMIQGTLVLQTACRHHYLAERCQGLLGDIASPVVMEIGGGAGTFAYYLAAGRRGLRYVNFDLPDTLALSSFYLGCAFPDAKIALYGEDHPAHVLANLTDYDFVLYPNFALPWLPADSVDLVTNTRSLSEMDYQTVAEYIRQIARVCRGYFVHENSTQASKAWSHVEVPAQEFPIDPGDFKLLYKNMSPWRSGAGRYRDHVFQKRVKAADTVHGGRRREDQAVAAVR